MRWLIGGVGVLVWCGIIGLLAPAIVGDSSAPILATLLGMPAGAAAVVWALN